ncbi:MAG: hypothetical protein ACE5IR_20925 [bacterium]
MKYLKVGLLIVVMLLFATNGFAQRNGQWEIFFGGAIPLGPDFVKDNFEVGGSFHVQYVMFLSPRLGLSFGLAGEAFTVNQDIKDAGVDIELTVAELGIGLRPYLTPMESNIQIYLFGMGTYNVVKSTIRDDSGFEEDFEEKKAGIAVGGGFEIPAGSKFNILLQGLGRVIFTEGDSFSFLGVTAGLAF